MVRPTCYALNTPIRGGHIANTHMMTFTNRAAKEPILRNLLLILKPLKRAVCDIADCSVSFPNSHKQVQRHLERCIWQPASQIKQLHFVRKNIIKVLVSTRRVLLRE